MRPSLHRLAVALSVALAFAIFLGFPLAARAQTINDEYGIYGYPHDNKVSVLGVVGVTGKAKLEENPFGLEATYGAAGRYEHPINRFIVLGGHFGLSVWVPSESHDLGAGRSTLLDLALFPKLRLPFSDRFEIYLAAPLGTCVSLGDSRNFGGTTDFATGWTVSGLFGMHLGIKPSTGLVLEGGYSLHAFTHEVIPFDGSRNFSVDVWLQQPWFLLGFYART